MHVRGFDVQYPDLSVRCLPSRFFHNKSKRIAFVHQPQFALRLIRGAGVHENSALDQVAVHIGHHAANIALGVRATGGFIFTLTDIDIIPDLFIILKEITMVDRINFTCFRAFDIRVAEGKFPNGLVERETVNPAAGGIDQHRG